MLVKFINTYFLLSYVDQHLNHDIELKHQRRTKFEEMKISKLLVSGKSSQDILLHFAKSKEIKMLTIKEITNIKNRYKIR